MAEEEAGDEVEAKEGRNNCNFYGSTLITVAISNVGSNMEHSRESLRTSGYLMGQRTGLLINNNHSSAAAVRGAGGGA